MTEANNYIAPSKRDIVAGLQFQFALPYKGYINVAPMYYQEVNHNAFAQCGAPFVAANNCDPNGVVRFGPTYSIRHVSKSPLFRNSPQTLRRQSQIKPVSPCTGDYSCNINGILKKSWNSTLIGSIG
jgi:hypothetical protein